MYTCRITELTSNENVAKVTKDTTIIHDKTHPMYNEHIEKNWLNFASKVEHRNSSECTVFTASSCDDDEDDYVFNTSTTSINKFKPPCPVSQTSSTCTIRSRRSCGSSSDLNNSLSSINSSTPVSKNPVNLSNLSESTKQLLAQVDMSKYSVIHSKTNNEHALTVKRDMMSPPLSVPYNTNKILVLPTNDLSAPLSKGSVVSAPTSKVYVMSAPTQNVSVVSAPTQNVSAVSAPISKVSVVSAPSSKVYVVSAPTQNVSVVSAPVSKVSVMSAPSQNVSAHTSKVSVVSARTSEVSVVSAPTLKVSVVSASTSKVSVVSAPTSKVSVVSAPTSKVSVVSVPISKVPVLTMPMSKMLVVSASTSTGSVVVSPAIVSLQSTAVCATPHNVSVALSMVSTSSPIVYSQPHIISPSSPNLPITNVKTAINSLTSTMPINVDIKKTPFAMKLKQMSFSRNVPETTASIQFKSTESFCGQAVSLSQSSSNPMHTQPVTLNVDEDKSVLKSPRMVETVSPRSYLNSVSAIHLEEVEKLFQELFQLIQGVLLHICNPKTGERDIDKNWFRNMTPEAQEKVKKVMKKLANHYADDQLQGVVQNWLKEVFSLHAKTLSPNTNSPGVNKKYLPLLSLKKKESQSALPVINLVSPEKEPTESSLYKHALKPDGNKSLSKNNISPTEYPKQSRKKSPKKSQSIHSPITESLLKKYPNNTPMYESDDREVLAKYPHISPCSVSIPKLSPIQISTISSAPTAFELNTLSLTNFTILPPVTEPMEITERDDGNDGRNLGSDSGSSHTTQSDVDVHNKIFAQIKAQSIAHSTAGKDGPLKCPKCKRKYRTPDSYKKHISNCSFYVSSSSDEESSDGSVQIVGESHIDEMQQRMGLTSPVDTSPCLALKNIFGRLGSAVTSDHDSDVILCESDVEIISTKLKQDHTVMTNQLDGTCDSDNQSDDCNEFVNCEYSVSEVKICTFSEFMVYNTKYIVIIMYKSRG